MELFNFREKETIEINFSHLFTLQIKISKSQIVPESGLESMSFLHHETNRDYSMIGETRTYDVRLLVP